MKDRDQEVTFSRYDAADYLKSDEDMLHYLEAVMEEGDPALIAAALGDIARARNLSQLARDVGMSREGLYKALSGEGNPTFATITKVAGALGLRFGVQLAKQPASHA
ncbi:addiction module antidote protein [Aeromonas dhakensis]|uniref:addiction module antidote protein n=1 Tax=Aeromonas dhakensis TaxID=196024 RepID=UPI00237A0168|nr:addiction module antidote protein [Aeromonas dhakensis]MDD9209833.1 putative addiction module antidote protein [Aeromonas dhakensis]